MLTMLEIDGSSKWRCSTALSHRSLPLGAPQAAGSDERGCIRRLQPQLPASRNRRRSYHFSYHRIYEKMYAGSATADSENVRNIHEQGL